jgi:hypothetical protein
MNQEVAFRLLLTGFCVVAPSLLYVGLVRALERLQDDPFVERVLERAEDEEPSPTGVRFPPVSGSAGRETPHDGPAVCDACGTHNPAPAAYCQNCLSHLDDSGDLIDRLRDR